MVRADARQPLALIDARLVQLTGGAAAAGESVLYGLILSQAQINHVDAFSERLRPPIESERKSRGA